MCIFWLSGALILALVHSVCACILAYYYFYITYKEEHMDVRTVLATYVHPAPYVHILAVGCTDFSTCAPGVCVHSSLLLLLYLITYKEEHMDVRIVLATYVHGGCTM